MITSIVGALIEAKDELRIQRMRVLLSLVGVAAAVMAMTSVLAIGQIIAQAQEEMMERWVGRSTTVYISPSLEDPAELDELSDAMLDFADQFSVEHYSRVFMTWATASTPQGSTDVDLMAVDPGYQTLHPSTMAAGGWFGTGDNQRLAPAVVVNEAFMAALGYPNDLSVQPEVTLPIGNANQAFVVIGIMADEDEWAMPTVYMLADSYLAVGGEAHADPTEGPMPPSLEIWVEPGSGEVAMEMAQSYFRPFVGKEGNVDAWSNESDGSEQDTFMATFRMIVLGVGTVVLAIGAISLVNISLVTVQQRIREIGIRRAFGATTGRVFFSIMMESVVATFAAGVVGVGLSILLVTRLPILEMLDMPVENMPPFPLSTALAGIVIATVIGALAGLIPGLVATRIKPIDAMRAA